MGWNAARGLLGRQAKGQADELIFGLKTTATQSLQLRNGSQ
jgi:hypothetical protein